MTISHETPVLIVGAGPAGLIAALQLAVNGTRSMLVERNLDTTKWPKMDITNVRSMELLKRLKIDQGLRKVGVPQHYSFDVHFSTGLSDGGERVTKWDLPSPDWWRTYIKKHNDGSMPREPYQRCSQAIFEAWLKPHIQAEPLVDSFFGLKLESLVESDDGVEAELVDATTGENHRVRAQYVIGCDGAGSRVRRSIGIGLTGGPVPAQTYLVHFKSRDLGLIQRQGQFWHIFFLNGPAVIAQDEIDTWTLHIPVPLGCDISTIDPEEAIYKALGGALAPLKIKIDEVLVKSAYRPNICLADRYISPKGRIFLSGDSAHQNIPTGGYGMNTAVGDSFDIGWKLAAVLAGYGGRALLQSYEEERRPVAARNIERSGVHWSVHAQYREQVDESGDMVIATGLEGDELRSRIAKQVEERDGENKDHGLEIGYRYNGSRVVVSDKDGSQEPDWNPRTYVPSTWPGARAPHVFLKDGETSIFDLFGTGKEFSLVDLTQDGDYIEKFASAAQKLGIPLKSIHVPEEAHLKKIWERDAVLVRPDDHVAWRAQLTEGELTNAAIEEILSVVVGKQATSSDAGTNGHGHLVNENGFTGTIGNVDQDKIEGLGEFQK